MTFDELDTFMREPKPQEYHSFTEANLNEESLLFKQQQVDVSSQELLSHHQGAPTALRLVPHMRYTPAVLHSHDFFELMYVYHGRIVHHLDGNPLVLEASDALLLPPGASHSIEAAGAEDLAVSLIMPVGYFTPDILSRMARLEQLSAFLQKHHQLHTNSDYLLWRGADSPQLRHYANSFLCEYFDLDRYSSAVLDAGLLLLLTALERLCPLDQQTQQGNLRTDLDRILEYIQQSYATVTLQELSSRFGYSENYLSRAIKSRLGVSFKDFRHQQCMRQAAFLLATTDYSVRQVSAEVGLANITFFYKLFERYYSMSPADYRQQCRSNTEP